MKIILVKSPELVLLDAWQVAIQVAIRYVFF